MKLRRKQPTSVQTKYGGLNSQEPAITYYLFKLKNSSKFEQAGSTNNTANFFPLQIPSANAGQEFFLGKNA